MRTASALVAALLPAVQAMYPKNSPVLRVDASSYKRLIAQSNYTSLVEFYAPWCGHCQNLKPAFEKAASELLGLAKVAAMDCDAEENKAFCSSMGIQGFPTLKTVRPSTKPGGKPIVEDYQGGRTAGAMIQATADKINNHVVRLSDKDLDKFLARDKPKFILFTNKGTTSALLRSIAIDFLDQVVVGQIRDRETEAVEKYGIEKFPTFVLFPGKDSSGPIKYDGEVKKNKLVEFLAQVAQPNPDPAPVTESDKKKKKTKKSKSDEKKAASEEKTKDTKEPSEETTTTTTTPEKETAKPAMEITPITAIKDKDTLEQKCLQTKSYTCVLALVPSEASEQGDKAVASLSQLNSKYLHGKRHLFPFFSVASDVDGTAHLRQALKLGSGVELIVVNARRGWWRRFEGDDMGVEAVEGWIDAIRMGEGQKRTLPEGVVVEAAKEEEEEEAKAEEKVEKVDDDAPEEPKIVHEEL
ncbi:PDI protein A prpA [Ophiocordyceps camponoti-floridani]|uniref:protein disulfide-isomerase n=1 Tax=Ophiocordyceps camponoti-floridani TaxID=2030778 RepID=A0A8H4VBE3_9HYPO|nr:PDI protein A prpA [Ophiocordyceps camponoti-floridani]